LGRNFSTAPISLLIGSIVFPTTANALAAPTAAKPFHRSYFYQVATLDQGRYFENMLSLIRRGQHSLVKVFKSFLLLA
jgi:hypothetical protein